MPQSGIGIRWTRIAACAAYSALVIGSGPRTLAADDKGKRGLILYVDDDAPSGGDGLSWETAFRRLQDVLPIANWPPAGVTEIRLGQGVYKPHDTTNEPPDVNAVFNIGAFALRGGYAGFGADDPDARDFKLYETILSGDLLGNDGLPGSFQNYQENSRRLILITNSSQTTIEGVTVTAVTTDIFQSSAPVRASASKLILSGCNFKYNRGWYGGVQMLDSDGVISDCTFYWNVAEAGSGGGGVAAFTSSVQILNCTFESNAASSISCGGGLFLAKSTAIIEGCTFASNYSNTDGGAAELEYSDALWMDCGFIANTCADSGGALSGEGFFGDPRDLGTLINCDFISNFASQDGGGVRGTGAFINCRFIDNFVSWVGGGGASGGGSFMNCEFRHNLVGALAGGGGVWVKDFGPWITADFINCIFNANDSWGPGGGVAVDPGLPVSFTNCTFTNNLAATAPFPVEGEGGAVYGEATIRNSILWNNSPQELDGTFDVTYSCIAGGWPGLGNLAADPQFINSLGPDGVAGTGDEDLRLSSGAPCIDSADNTALPSDAFDLDGDTNTLELLPFDFAGNPRRINDPKSPDTGNPGIYHVVVDMGAMEFAEFEPVFADITGDGWVGVEDLLAVISSWGPCPGEQEDCLADVDKSGAVDGSDLSLVLQNWS